MRVPHDDRLGHFKGKALRRQPGAHEHIAHGLRQIVARKLCHRQVDRNLATFRHALDLVACGFQDPLADLHDPARTFRNRNELRRRYPPKCGMVPARKRFEADDAARPHVDLRLEVRKDLGLCQPFLEVGLDATTPGRIDTHAVIIDLHLAFSRRLGVTECKVGILQDVDAATPTGACKRQPDGRIHDHIAPGDGMRLMQCPADLMRALERLGLATLHTQQHGELVTAKPRGDISLAPLRDHPTEPARHRDQQVVTSGMAENVVHGLEAIKIERKDRNVFPRVESLRLEAMDLRLKHGVERRPVGQSGQRIMAGDEFEAARGALCFGSCTAQEPRLQRHHQKETRAEADQKLQQQVLKTLAFGQFGAEPRCLAQIGGHCLAAKTVYRRRSRLERPIDLRIGHRVRKALKRVFNRDQGPHGFGEHLFAPWRFLYKGAERPLFHHLQPADENVVEQEGGVAILRILRHDVTRNALPRVRGVEAAVDPGQRHVIAHRPADSLATRDHGIRLYEDNEHQHAKHGECGVSELVCHPGKAAEGTRGSQGLTSRSTGAIARWSGNSRVRCECLENDQTGR